MDILQLHDLQGAKARHTPYELIEGKWQRNTEHEEGVTLLEYFNFLEKCSDFYIHQEGILFIRSNWTLGRDRLDSFTIIHPFTIT